jgi:hypothetical protein
MVTSRRGWEALERVLAGEVAIFPISKLLVAILTIFP